MAEPDRKSGSGFGHVRSVRQGSVSKCGDSAVQPQDGYPCHGQRVDRVQDPEMSTEIILATSTVS